MDLARVVARPEQAPNTGATFYRCALQVNPGRYLERFRGQDHGLGQDYAEQIISKCLAVGIAAIGITDHNDFSSVPEFQKLAAGRGLTVFPGVEVASAEGIHLLCLYPPDTQSDQLALHLGNLGITRPGPSSDLSILKFNVLLSKVREQGGVAIAAHITNDKGLLRQVSGQARAQLWKDENLIAVQIPGKIEDLEQHFKKIIGNNDPEYRRSTPVGILNASDVDEPSDLEKSSASTLIKMSSPSISGLRQAFLDPNSRIRLNTDEAPHGHTKFKSISWQGGFLDGVSIDFNENLNVLIGGRGSGKSTVIESLRYALDLSPLGEDASKAHKGVLQNVLKSGTKITLHLSSPHPSASDYTIERTVPNPPVVRCGTQLLRLAPGDVAPNVEVYGQHEISELARSKEKLTNLLYRFIDDDHNTNDQMAAVRKGLAQSRQRIVETQNEIAEAKERLSELPALEEAQRRFQQAGLEKKLKTRSLLVREDRLLHTAMERLQSIETAAGSLKRTLPLDIAFLSPKALEELPNQILLQKATKILDEVSTEVSRISQALNQTLEKCASELRHLRSEWEQEKSKAQQEYEQLLRELQKDRIDGNEFIQLREQMERMRPIQERLSILERTLVEQQSIRFRLIAEWIDLTGQAFRRIEKAAKSVTKALKGRVKVTVMAGGNREPFETLLKQQVGGRLQESLVKLANEANFSPITFASACRAGRPALIDKFHLSQTQADNLANMGPDLIMRIEELHLPPVTIIELNTAHDLQEPNWQSLDLLSTGQKATAVLLLLLLDSDAPLVVDQPEDDLDNRFISESVVPKMRDEKLKRQFIFATHNANIPVLGDAELILALTPNGEAGQGTASIQPEHRGSIDSPSVRAKVEEILEGGKEAFESRRRKYGY